MKHIGIALAVLAFGVLAGYTLAGPAAEPKRMQPACHKRLGAGLSRAKQSSCQRAPAVAPTPSQDTLQWL